MREEKCLLCKNISGGGIIKWHEGVRDNKEAVMYKCTGCGLLFCSSYYDVEVFNDEFYENGGMHIGNDDYMSIEERKKVYIQEDQRRAEDIKEYIEDKEVLDFGCSYGGFLDAASVYAKSVYGCEVESEAVEYCKSERKYDVVTDIDENERKYDVVVMSHVIEHLIEPTNYLNKIINHIKSEGYLILEFPNADEALVTLYDSAAYKKFTYMSQHVCMYNENTIELLLRKVGFRIKDIKYIQRYPLANHMYWLAKGKAGGHKVWDWLLDDQIDAIYERKLREKKRTDTIIVIAERII